MFKAEIKLTSVKIVKKNNKKQKKTAPQRRDSDPRAGPNGIN